MERNLTTLGQAVTDAMPAKTELVWVDYRDELTDEQVRAIVRGDTDALWDAVSEFESDSRWQGACDLVDDLARDVIRRWERADDADYSELLDCDWPGSDERRDAIDEAMERDSSDVVSALARNSGQVLLRLPIPALDEDADFSGDAGELLAVLGFEATPNNVEAAEEIIANAAYPGAVLMGYALVAVRPSDVWGLPLDGRVEIRNPHIYLGNPFAGNGWASGPFEGSLIYERTELRTDRDAFGYSWTEIAGPVVSAYEGEISPVKEGDNA